MITENGSLNSLLNALNVPSCRNLAVSIIRYLTQQQINTLCVALQNHNSPHFLVQLLRTLRFVNGYLNSIDKSLYFTFYDEEQYKKIEIQHIAAISRINSNHFLQYEKQFQIIKDAFKLKVPAIQAELQTLHQVLINPELPLPKLKRQTQGMYCSSPFQLFLVCSTFNEDPQDEFFSCFDQFKQFLSIEKQQQYLKHFMTILKEKHSNGAQLKKIKQVRYTPYEITASNLNDFMIQNNQLHNFIVGLFALTDLIVKSTHEYIQFIADPLHRLVELTLRYNIYRNYVLAIEQYLPFVFRMYENIYREAIEDGANKPKYNFWRPALSKWYLQMGQLHKESEQVYMLCLTKLRNLKFKAEITEQYKQDQQRYGPLLTALQQNKFQNDLSVKIFGNIASEMSMFFDESPQNYQMVVMEFNEYLIDISINEQTVHWCGHTSQQLEKPYLDYEKSLIELSQNYYISLNSDHTLSPQDMSMLGKIDVQYISTLQIKNRSLKQLADLINNHYQLGEGLQILGDFEEADKKLQYFNHKALILAVVDQNARPFYSIPPHYTPEKLIDMIDTNDSSNNNSDAQVIEYMSESEAKEGEEGEKMVKKSFVQYELEEYEQESAAKSIQKRALSKRQPRSTKTFLDQEQQEEELMNLKRKATQVKQNQS